MVRILPFLWLLLSVVVLALPAAAHPLSFGSARLEQRGSSLQGELVLDVPAAVLAQSDAVRRAELLEQVRTGFRVEAAGNTLTPEVRIEALGQGEEATDVVSVGFDVGEARALRFVSSEALGDVAIELADTERTYRERLLLAAGERSREIPLGPRAAAAPGGTARGEGVSGSTPEPTDVATETVERSLFDYLRMGFFHIVPEGVDHFLFVTTMVLLLRRVGQLLVIVSLFTLGHALSVTLSVYGLARLGASWVEPLIALSLAYGALEWKRPNLAPARPAIALGFGLVHGLGFAGALGRVGVPEPERLWAVIGFNVGVEVGQVVVALVPLLGLYWVERRRETDRFREWGLVAIAVVGLGWALLRVVGG